MPIRVAVIGGGSWGTTVAHLCAKNTPTTLWSRREDVAVEVTLWHGRQDTAVPLAAVEAAAARLPSATLEVLPDAGHVGWLLRERELLEVLAAG